MGPDATRMIAREVLPAPPAPRQQLWRVLRHVMRRRTGDGVIPGMSVEVPALRSSPRRLLAYRAICGFRDAGLPVTFPQVQAAGLQIHLLTRREFPLPLLGVVHVRNTIRQIQPLHPANEYRVQVEVLGGGPVQGGVEFAVATRYFDDRTLVWESVATGLRRSRRTRGRKRTRAAQEPADRFQEYATFDVPSDIGRRYGRISGDMNPIHLSRLGARLFGLPGHIAHGMWSLARCLALLQDTLPAPPFEVAVEFKQPVLLPSRVSLLHAAGIDSVAFALTAHDRSRLHLLGSIGAAR